MAKQELDEEMKNNDTDRSNERHNKKEVIITVYVESPSELHSHSHQRTDHFKKINPNPNSRKPHQSAKTRSYDRRAHLLAYSQELRTAGDSQEVQWPKNGSKAKSRVGSISKKFRTPVRLRRTKSRWRYQRLVSEVDLSCNPKSLIGRKKSAAGSETNSNLLKKFRGIVRGLSWDCKKGSKVAERNHAV